MDLLGLAGGIPSPLGAAIGAAVLVLYPEQVVA